MSYSKQITYFGEQVVIACDGKCHKAWGINNRERIRFDDEDDYAYLADDEVGVAPEDPGTYEGCDGKPDMWSTDSQKMNRWCARECERRSWHKPGEPIVLRDFSVRRYNQPSKHVMEPNNGTT